MSKAWDRSLREAWKTGNFQSKLMKTEVHSNYNYEVKVDRITKDFNNVLKGT